jgi:hypothetical protein
MNELAAKKIYRKKDMIISRRIAGEKLLVPIAGNIANLQQIFALNPVAEFIWDHLDGKTSLGDIHSLVLTQFRVDPPEAERDLQDFMRELTSLELAVPVDDP